MIIPPWSAFWLGLFFFLSVLTVAEAWGPVR